MGRHILFIDDDIDDFVIFTEVLGEFGVVSCSYANGGKNGIQMISENTPDLIMLDLNMPGMNGLECLEQIRLRSAAPIIIFSTHISDDVRSGALRGGAVACIQKPCSYVEMKELVALALRRGGIDAKQVLKGKSGRNTPPDIASRT